MKNFFDLDNKFIRSIIAIIFFAIALFSANYIIGSLWSISGKLYHWFLPFIIAMLLSYILEPFIQKMEKYLNRDISSGIILLFINVILIGMIAYSITRLSTEAMELKNKLPYLYQFTQEKLLFLQKGASDFYGVLPVPVAEYIEGKMHEVFVAISELMSKSIYVLRLVPGIMKALVIWLISNFIAYLILRDREQINTFFKNTVAESWQDELKIINTQIIKAVMGFIKAQIILIVVMFFVSLVGLLIINSPYVVIISILAGLFSIIPVIGTGTVFIPLIITIFSIGNISLSVKLLIVYVFTIIIREVVMIKVVSHSVGLDLLTTIISMYVGIEIFGELGFIIGPLIFIMFKVIFNSSLMDRFRKRFNLI